MAGTVFVNEQKIDKPGTKIPTDAKIAITSQERYVGRGGYKLEGALQHFQISPQGLDCIDVGASTGGFTDCLLQNGAAQVWAVDVGHSQLDWKIRSDSRVVVREKFNARYMSPADFDRFFDLAVIDVSFISLELILGPVFSVLKPNACVIALIKPQFEVPKENVGKGGVIRDPALHQQVIEKIQRFCQSQLGYLWQGVIESPITGTDGNQEFLACIQKQSD